MLSAVFLFGSRMTGGLPIVASVLGKHAEFSPFAAAFGVPVNGNGHAAQALELTCWPSNCLPTGSE